jgi:prolipoprotein diacylglyceryltransferase
VGSAERSGIQLLGRRNPGVGPVFRASLTFYGVERFFLELVRLETELYSFGLTGSEMASVLLLGITARADVHGRCAPA